MPKNNCICEQISALSSPTKKKPWIDIVGGEKGERLCMGDFYRCPCGQIWGYYPHSGSYEGSWNKSSEEAVEKWSQQM
jgi:hypothetical protein